MKSSFFAENRRMLSEAIKDELVVIASHGAMQWHGDAAVPFRQEANFWYLSGIEHANWRLVIDSRAGKSWLIAPEVDAAHELFDGSLSHQDAKRISGVDEVLSQKAGQQFLKDAATNHRTVYTLGSPPYAEYVDFTLNPAADVLHKELQQLFDNVKDCRSALSKLRAIKQPVEITMIEQAAGVSIEAFERAKRTLATCEHEYEADAELTHCFRRHNAAHAFEPIVASGKNACTLHYTANSSQLVRADLVLIDAGARLGGYSADITRTYGLNEVTERQVAVHAAVQSAEQQIIELVRPGFALKSYQEAVDGIMKEALLSLGLMKRGNDAKAYRRYFPHAISHGLGLDVHESLGGVKEFQPGMLLTVEPGIYIPEEGIGVRIEDNILVTDTGHRNLTGTLSTDL